jgi:hypothetical protein
VPNHQSLLQSLDEIIERMGINGDTKNILKVSESLLKYSLGVLVKRKACIWSSKAINNYHLVHAVFRALNTAFIAIFFEFHHAVTQIPGLAEILQA